MIACSPWDLFFQLADGLLEYLNFTFTGSLPRLQQGLLGLPGFCDAWLVFRAGGYAQCVGLLQLGEQSCFQGRGGYLLIAQHFTLGLQLRGVQADQYGALADLLAITHMQGADNAALQVLYGLAVALDRDDPRGQRGTVQRGDTGPTAKYTKYQEQHAIPDTSSVSVVEYRGEIGCAHELASAPGLLPACRCCSTLAVGP